MKCPVREVSIAKKPSSFNAWFTTQLALSGVSIEDLAKELGIGRNMISVWKAGKAPIPMKHIFKIASMFGSDPLYVRNLFFKENFPGLWEMDERVRKLSEITENELEFLKILREGPVANPKMNDEQKEQFKKFVESLSGENGINKNTPDKIITD